MTDQPKLSPVEKIKAQSNYLRGTVVEELATDAAAFDKDTTQLLKHHGMYQQEDRDRRGGKGPDGKPLEKAYSMMVRTKLPGGKLTGRQLLVELDLCDELGNTTMRLTDRQGIQLHGVLKKNVRETVRRINEAQMTTLGACGDVERNVLCCPAPFRHDRVRQQMQEMADRISAHLLPRTTAYHELWLTDPVSGEKQLAGGGADGHEIEPIYGPTYLPRKFKTAIVLPEDNCVDVYTNDLGLVAIVEGKEVVGYNFLVGGGLGVTPSRESTFPALAKPLAFVPNDQVLDVATALIEVQRDFGNREDRKRARMKYLIADWGMEKFRAKVEEYYGRKLVDPRPVEVHGFDDHMGWHQQGDGRWFYGLNVENGRVLDRERFRLKTALREICETYQPGLRITGHQSLLLTDIRPEDRDGLEAILRRNGVRLSEEISAVRRWSMACVALPTCPLAVAESERVLPGLIDRMEEELARLGLADEVFTVRMTGCPNGCARPYNADVGIVAKTKGKYTIYLGGRRLGDRLGFVYKELVPLEEIVAALVPVFTYFRQDRQDGETLGDFCDRMGVENLTAWSQQRAAAGA